MDKEDRDGRQSRSKIIQETVERMESNLQQVLVDLSTSICGTKNNLQQAYKDLEKRIKDIEQGQKELLAALAALSANQRDTLIALFQMEKK